MKEENENENENEVHATEEKRSGEKDRFKTRILSKTEFEEIVKCQVTETTHTASPQSALVSSLHKSDSSTATSDNDESFHERAGAKIGKPPSNSKVIKSGIPVVNSKLPKTKSKFSNSAEESGRAFQTVRKNMLTTKKIVEN